MAKGRRSFFEKLTGGFSPLRGEEEELEPDDYVARRNGPIVSDGSEKPAWPEAAEEEGELAVDVYQTPSDIYIKTMTAGVRPEDLTINITRDMVTIRGRREIAEEVRADDYFQQELYWGSFAKTILLPAEVEADEAEATERHGLLTIRLPKIDKDKVKKIKVKSV